MKNLAVLYLTVMGLTVGTVTLRSQTFTSLYSFSGLQGTSPKTNFDGQAPYGSLLLSGDTLYGTTCGAGTNGSGTVFSIKTNGSGFTVLHSFAALVNGTNADGACPYGGLVLSGGTLYGTTSQGSILGWGTVFGLSTSGTNFSLLHVFTNGLDGAQPHAGMLLFNGTLYGTTIGTASNNSFGTIFSIGTNSSFAALHSFNTNIEGGLARAGLTVFSNVLYGTTYYYGSNGVGSVYSINTDGTGFTVLHNFALSSDGGVSEAPLVFSGNTLFGTTSTGGSNGWGTVFSLSGSTFNVLHTFAGDIDGGVPAGGLTVLGNTLYGTTQQGGSINDGTVFSVRTNGAGFIVLHTFSGVDGAMPYGGLVLSGKTAYGTTTFGGTYGNNSGTLYIITVPMLSITNFALSGFNITFNAADGLSNGTYSVLTSTNLGTPLAQWTPIAITVLSNNGPFSITATNAISPANHAGFYTLQLE